MPAERTLATRLLLLASVLVWGSTFVAMKIALAEVSPFELVGLRFAIGLPLLWLVLRTRGIPVAFDRRDLPALACGSAILAAHFLAQPFALSLAGTTATNTSWIIAFSPLAILLLSRAFLRERVGAGQAVGVAIATFGIVLLVSRGELANLAWVGSRGDWIVLGTAFTWAFYTIATRDLSRRRSPLGVTLVVFLPVTLGCLAGIAARSDLRHLARLSPRVVLALLFLGVLGTLAQWFWQVGVARLGAARAGVYLYLEPLATTALAVPLLGESLGPAGSAGGVLVLLGVWLGGRSAEGKPAPAAAEGAS